MQRPGLNSPLGHRVRIATIAIVMLAAMPLALAQMTPAPAGTLDRIQQAGRIKLGYRTDARPFSYRDESGQAAGYSITLCQRIADTVKADLKLSALNVEWVPVTVDSRFRAVQQGEIDVLCGAETVTLSRRAEVAFSIPVFPGGVGALIRADAPPRLREVLEGRGQTFRPTWRASASQVLQARAFSAMRGTTADKWLAERVTDLQLVTKVVPADSYDDGVRRVVERQSDAFFGERAILLDATTRNPSARDLVVIDRLFTYEPLAFAIARGNEDFRLLVDRAISGFYRSDQIGGLYTKWFGEPDQNALTFFRWNALAE